MLIFSFFWSPNDLFAEYVNAVPDTLKRIAINVNINEYVKVF